MKTLSITVEEPLLKSLDRAIQEGSIAGRSEAIRQAIRDWLKQRELRKKLRREVQGYQKRPVKKDEFESLLSVQGIPK